MNTNKIIHDYLEDNDWRVKENANMSLSISGLEGYVIQHINADYALKNIFNEQEAKAHKDCDLHIHDLGSGGMKNYCLGVGLEEFLFYGLDDLDGCAKHFTTALRHIENFTFAVSQEIAGAVAWNDFDVYLAPYIKNDKLTYKEVKQAIQQFIFTINHKFRIGYQCVDQDTEVLTPNGFKKYNEVNIGDDIYTWKDGKLNINKIQAVSINNHKGKMHVYSSRDYIQQVTDNHNVLHRKYNTHEYELSKSKDLINNKTGHYLPIATDGLYYNTSCKLNDLQIQLLALILTNGSIEPDNRIKLYRSTNKEQDNITNVLDGLNINYSLFKRDKTEFGSYINHYSILSEDTKWIKEIINTKEKIPDILFSMNREQALLFLKTWASQDGHWGEKIKLQADNDLIASQLQHLGVIAGFGSRIQKRLIGINKQGTTHVQFYKRKNKYANNNYEVDYDGIVWCPSTQDGIVVYRKDNRIFISGNSPFTNVQLSIMIPKRLQGKKAMIGKEAMDFTYDDCLEEAGMITKAMLEVLLESKRPLTFPVINIGVTRKYLDEYWNTDLNNLITRSIAELGQPTINNYVNGYYDPDTVRSMCCSIRLDFSELQKQSGGQFGASDNSGSVCVVTLNLPRIAYEARLIGDHDEVETMKVFQKILDKRLELAKSIILKKRQFIEDLMSKGYYPNLNRFIDNFANFFNTIGIIGLNEMCMNYLGDDYNIETEDGIYFSKVVINHINNKIKTFQGESKDWYNGRGLYWNLELVPAEGVAHRFAKHDKFKYDNIITANGSGDDYYTRGCWLPADQQYNLSFASKHQDELQDLFSGGANFNLYLEGSNVRPEAIKDILYKLLTNTSLPFISISPTIYICPICGKKGEEYCYHPELKKEGK